MRCYSKIKLYNIKHFAVCNDVIFFFSRVKLTREKLNFFSRLRSDFEKKNTERKNHMFGTNENEKGNKDNIRAFQMPCKVPTDGLKLSDKSKVL